MQIIIQPDDMLLIEKAYYEYNASLNILSYLLKQKEINENYLNQYLKKSEEYYIYFEELKQSIFIKYQINIANFKNYSFDFESNILILERK